MRGTEDAKRRVACPSVMPAEAGIQGRPEACVEPRMRSVASLAPPSCLRKPASRGGPRRAWNRGCEASR
ncbi:MAG: hypothetical protein OXR07_08185, partial [Nitrospira sp.]|nr:hypothetical protein [Nitrospira sp.]